MLKSDEVDLLRAHARQVIRELGLLKDSYADLGVTLVERHLLIELSQHPDITAKEVAEHLLVDKSTMSRLVSRAIKKKFVELSPCTKDARKKLLKISAHGKKVLSSFESLAYRHTEDSLLFLSEEEVNIVYRGVALYAKGLELLRLKKEREENSNLISSEVKKNLVTLNLIIRPFESQDREALHSLFYSFYHSGNYLGVQSDTLEEFYRQFIGPKAYFFTCLSKENEVIGGFCVRPNLQGDMRSLANAVYMVKREFQGRGIGKILVEASLNVAKKLGYSKMQFNSVFEENISALKLYEKIGFQVAEQPNKSNRGYVLYKDIL
jgi:putative acetyltransferase